MEDRSQIKANDGRSYSLTLQTLLVPTDFSPGADEAFAYALDLARRHHAKIHLLHVLGPIEGNAYSPLRYSPEAHAQHETPEKIAYDLLQSQMKKHDTEGVAVEPVKTRASAVASAVVKYAKSEGVDLIVMGTHGRQGVERFMLGSVAERTVRQAPCSVLTVRQHADASELEIHRILVPLDFSEHSGRLLQAAYALAASYEAQLDLVHVIEQPLFVGMLGGAMTANDLVPDIGKRAEKELQRLWEREGGDQVQAKVHVTEGHAASHITELAEQLGTDLIVIASQGRSGIEHFLIGSVAERVVRAAPCPVFTFKPSAGAGTDA